MEGSLCRAKQGQAMSVHEGSGPPDGETSELYGPGGLDVFTSFRALVDFRTGLSPAGKAMVEIGRWASSEGDEDQASKQGPRLRIGPHGRIQKLTHAELVLPIR